MKIQDFIPDSGKNLASYKGSALIDRIGENAIKEVVCNILCGSNIRTLTETLTRKRITLSNAALLMTYLNAGHSIKELQNNLFDLVAHEFLHSKLSKEEKQYLQWLVGLTGKGVQNILRGKQEEFIEYLNELKDTLEESSNEVAKVFGDVTGSFFIQDQETKISWPVITQIFTAIGAQTLAIRGSEKSMYGKIFEKFILGTLLTILGFSYSDKNNLENAKMAFWLSERGNKRESDATALIEKGVGVRFDIGFIGPGNTEISLDKVSRFESEMELGRRTHYMATIIIVDRIGYGSRIVDMANEMGGHIVQMSMSFWVKEVAQLLRKTTGFSHRILEMRDEDSLQYVKDAVEELDLRQFI